MLTGALRLAIYKTIRYAVSKRGSSGMENLKVGASELSRASLRRMEALLGLLREIQIREDAPSEVLAEFQRRYQDLPREERPYLFDALVRRFETQRQEIEAELRLLLEGGMEDPLQWSRQLSSLRRKTESPRIRVFRKFINLSGGLKFLLDLRADVLAAQRQASLDLSPLDEDIAHLFNSWFQNGFLFLQEITQESPYRQILFLKEHEMVHPMTSLEEMGERLGHDRRCFALYHRAMPEEPVVFIEVALTRGIARSIHEVIRQEGERGQTSRSGRDPDTAIFYSINNTQNGLAGLGLGKVLIFQVVDALKRDCPGIKTFCTLSPIPGFWERYLRRILQGDDGPFAMKRERIEEFFSEKARQAVMGRHSEVAGGQARDLQEALLAILSDPGWVGDPVYSEWLKRPLTEIAYFYVSQEKDKQGKPLNPVANFHLGNGATVSLKNVNFAANRSPRGAMESCGMMVNYLYSRTWLQEIGRTMKSLIPWKV
jgi:malonyl-CoA decarboxylase